jgi:probable rRNA maturation factor
VIPVFDLRISSALWKPAKRWRAVVARALDVCTAEFGSQMADREISILLCDDEEMRVLNRNWRGMDKPTNVLSFPSSPESVGAPLHAAGAPLGDIAIAWETVVRESESEDKTVEDHVTHLTIHGVLHLIGFDHETSDDAERMEGTERRLLARLGIADPYKSAEPAIEGSIDG